LQNLHSKHSSMVGGGYNVSSYIGGAGTGRTSPTKINNKTSSLSLNTQEANKLRQRPNHFKMQMPQGGKGRVKRPTTAGFTVLKGGHLSSNNAF
jgi:hypothetical protein